MTQDIGVITIPDDAWEPNNALDDPLAALLTTVFVNGLPLHLEAWEVFTDTDGVQHAKTPYDEDFGAIHNAVHGDGPFMTTSINGRNYVIIATPYCE